MNPVNKYLQAKHANFFNAVRQGFSREAMGQVVGSVGREVLVGAGALALTGAAAKVFQAVTKGRDYRRMLASNPDLTEYRQENPKLFNQHYNSLRAMNPDFASDPIVAGSYMRKMQMNPQTAGQVIVESLGGRPPHRVDAELGLDTDRAPTLRLKRSL